MKQAKTGQFYIKPYLMALEYWRQLLKIKRPLLYYTNPHIERIPKSNGKQTMLLLKQ